MILFPHTDFKDLKDCYAIRYAMIALQGRVLCPPITDVFLHTDLNDLKDCYTIRYAVIKRKKRNNTVCVIGNADII